MKNKLLSFVLLIIVLITTFSNSIIAVENDDSLNTVTQTVNQIIDTKLQLANSNSIQEWIDNELSQQAGIGSEWYILTLSQYDNYDFSNYQKELIKYVDSDKVFSASTREKYALCLIATGSNNYYIQKTANDSIGTQGIMSLVFGLHLLNNGYKSDTHSIDTLLDTILSLQKEDGGWALSSNFGDVDVTAMTVQALAPNKSSTKINNSINKAIDFLSSRQNDDGDFSSYGLANPESTSQVLLALSSIGIDAFKDERFIKNEKTILDGLLKYKLEDGTFCHVLGSESNDTATVQAFYSLVSYIRYKNNKTPFYILDNANPEIINTDDNQSNNIHHDDIIPTWKIITAISLAVVALIICLVLFIIGKRNKKNYIAVIIAFALIIIVLLITNIQSVDDYYNDNIKKDDIVGKISFSIRCDTLIDKEKSEYIPEDGIILKETQFDIDNNDTVFDILIEACKKYKIQLDYNGNSSLAYISGINYLYEFAYGDLSGWVYEVNGVQPSVGCGEYDLKDGDVVVWHYTCNLGNDINK